jgi:hypothetical protein
MSILIVSVIVMLVVFGCRWEKIERPDISEPDIALAVESTTTTTATATNISNTTTVTTTTITDTSWCNTTDTTYSTSETCDVAATVITCAVQETTARPTQTYSVVMETTECTHTAAETNTACTTTVSTVTQFPASDIYRYEFVKTFVDGSYYSYGKYGGSGRELIACDPGNSEIKGSIASSYLWNNYGYNYKDSRTMVYLRFSQYPQMDGFYYLDDCCAQYLQYRIDFFFPDVSKCPFGAPIGITKDIDCWIVYKE